MGRATWSVGLAIVLGSTEASAVSYDVTSETTPKPGVRVQKLAVHGPTTSAWAVYVDLCAKGVHVDATAKTSTLRTAGTWASSVGAALATNGDFYHTGPVRVYGPAVGGGAAWPSIQTGTDPAYENEWYYQHYGWIAFGPNWVEFDHTEWIKNHSESYPIREGWRPTDVTHAIPHGTLALVSGFPELVVEGKPVTCTSPTAASCFPDRSDMRDRNPRTAMGLTEDRRTFMLVVVDGRTATSAGLYGSELADLVHQLGAWVAFNIDGGGSSQLWLEGKGYLNDTNGNSGGGTRAVANHWGVFAGTSAPAGHCIDDLVTGVFNAAIDTSGATTDIDGDGTADVCIRGPDGVHCASGGADSPDADEPLVGLTDASGWDDVSNAATLRMGDIDGDGRADLCARANAGIRCWTSAAGPLATPIVGPALADDKSWGNASYFATLRLADVTGDGRDDLCARAAAGLRCWSWNDSTFEATVAAAAFSNDEGMAPIDKAGTLRFGDIDGDGKADACARTATGMVCWRSDGVTFGERVDGPAWADDKGWSDRRYWSTIRLVDVDGDGRADLCARSAADFRCHLSDGASFGPPIVLTALSNDAGFDAPSSYATLRMADVDGDGDLEVCARHEGRFDCWPWIGDGFGDAIVGPALPDADGYDLGRLYASPRLADVSGDGKSDVCVRDDGGVRCLLSDGEGFPTEIAGPAWSGIGWESASVWGTLTAAGPRCIPGAETCNGRDDDCNGEIDEGCEGHEEPTGGGAGAVGARPASGEAGDEGETGCACRAAAGPGLAGGYAAGLGVAIAVAALLRARRARAGQG